MADELLVFVSHSSHADGGQFRDAFVTELESMQAKGLPSVRTMVDTELLAGVEWNSQLYEWMAEAHAAVILLNEAAIASKHVLQEATSLMWRACLDDDFVLVPVRLGAVDEAVLRDGPLGPLEIHRIQWIAPKDAKDLAVKVRKRLAKLRRQLAGVQTPLERLIGALAARLRDADQDGLDAIADLLLVDRPGWRPQGVRGTDHASHIARRLLRDGGDLGKVKDLAGLVDELRGPAALNSGRAIEVLEYVAPMWVSLEAAGLLPEVAKRPAKKRWAAAMNGVRLGDYTVEMYVNRAYPVTKRYRISQLAGGYDSGSLGEQFEAELRLELQTSLRVGDEADLDDRLTRVDEPYFVILPKDDDLRSVLGDVLTRYPMLTFIVQTGKTLEPSKLFGRVCAIDPPVGEDERRRAEDYEWARELAQK
jgi:hypothetical protein